MLLLRNRKFLFLSLFGALIFVAVPHLQSAVIKAQWRHQARSMSDDQLRKWLKNLGAEFLPPNGTTLSEVESVYGACKSGGAVYKSYPQCHIPLWNDRNGHGAALELWVKQGKIDNASIVHGGMMGGFKQTAVNWARLSKNPKSLENAAFLRAQQQEIIRQKSAYRSNDETRLDNFLIIHRMWGRTARSAPWNR
jgi:hypothetical protein